VPKNQKDTYHHAVAESGLNMVHDVLEYKRGVAHVFEPSWGSTWVGVSIENETAVNTLDVYGNMLRDRRIN
jgi:hypothetical protein